MIVPAHEQHTVYQGATWQRRYLVVNESNQAVDITGCTATLSARETPESTTALFTLTGTVAGPSGSILFELPAADTVDETWVMAYFDAELYWTSPAGKIDKLAYGTMSLVREITRA